MKKIAIISIFVVAFVNTINAQVSFFQGTWKWENGNETFYVYITSETIQPANNKVLSIDYKRVEIQGSTLTEVYNSKIQNVYCGAGGLLSEGNNESRGTIWDRTHPDTTDMYEGRIFLRRVANNPNALHWELLPLIDNIQGKTTPNPPYDFNVPKDIVLTKVSNDILYD